LPSPVRRFGTVASFWAVPVKDAAFLVWLDCSIHKAYRLLRSLIRKSGV
jgi:hypothetical protein